MATQTARQHAVEEVDTDGNCLDERHRVTDAHQVAQPIARQLVRGGGQRGQHLVADFQQTPTSGPAAAGSIPGRIVGATATEPPRVTVDVQEVLIEVERPAAQP